MLSSDNKLKSVYNLNECLNVNNSKNPNGTLEIANCLSSSNWNFIGGTGQLQSSKVINGKNMCLSNSISKDNKTNNVGIDVCVNGGGSPSQSWAFY